MAFTLLGLGTAVPPIRVRQEHAAAVARLVAGCSDRQGALLTTLYRQTDIATRHMVPGQDILADALAHVTGEHNGCPPHDPADLGPTTAERMQLYEREVRALALPAAQRALQDARVAAADITHLITVSCTGFAAPGFDIGLIKGLGLAPTVQRTHVGFMGCHGALNGLAVARALAAQPGARVLLCAAELCSLHYHYPWDPKRAVGNALFADGAAALVGAALREDAAWRVCASGSCLFPDSEAAMTWTIGDHGFAMTLSPRVPGLIAAHLRLWLEDWLATQELRLDDIGSWAIHPGGPRIVGAVEEALGLAAGTARVSREVLSAYGNMSSATILFILERLRRSAAPRPCVALGFGPGLVAEVALFR
jgi:predicted naringenin-chalcone synthase